MTERSNDEGPLVSVIIPTYNSAHTIARAIQSVAAQTYDNIELILVDDQSQDETVAVVGDIDFAGPKSLIVMEKNGGASAARNRGIAEARGRYVAFLDSDDQWMLDKLARQVEMMESHPALTILGGQGLYRDKDGNDCGPIFCDPPPISTDFWKHLLRVSYIHTSTVITRLDLLQRLGAFDESLIVAEDQDLWIRLALEGESGVLSEPLVAIYDLPDSLMSRNAARAAEFVMPMVGRHLEANRARLSGREVRRILGVRMSAIGRGVYFQGDARVGAKLLLGAIIRGERPMANIFYLFWSSPPLRWLKRKLGRSRHRGLSSQE